MQISIVQHSGVMTKKFSNSISKVNLIIDTINEKIIDGRLTVGDNLPSINGMSQQCRRITVILYLKLIQNIKQEE